MKQIFHAYILNTEFNAADADMWQFISDVLGKEINPDDLSLEPDIIILEKRKERKNIIDADVEAAMRSLELKPFGDRKLLIISHSDLMTVRAQNRILKKLEEPSGDAVIALVTRTPDLMLDTIRSRCIEKRFDFKQNFSGFISSCLLFAVLGQYFWCHLIFHHLNCKSGNFSVMRIFQHIGSYRQFQVFR